jgi:hypothetical protein
LWIKSSAWAGFLAFPVGLFSVKLILRTLKIVSRQSSLHLYFILLSEVNTLERRFDIGVSWGFACPVFALFLHSFLAAADASYYD